MTIRKKQIDDLIALLCREYPKTFILFERRRVPLKLRIDQDLDAALEPAIDRRLLGRALWHYTNNLFYRIAQQAGHPRFDLDGNVAGSVSQEDAASAARTVAVLKAAVAQRKQEAFRKTAPPPEPPPPPPPPKRDSLSSLRAAARWRKVVA